MKRATGKSHLVSVIIPAFNEQAAIVTCLKSVKDSDYKNIEVVLVDDCSADDTSKVAQEFARKNKLNFKIIRNKSHKERGVTRNMGAKEAKGEYLLFIDADMKVGKKVITECVEMIKKDGKTGAIIIPEESYGEGFWSQCRALEKKCYLKDDKIEAVRFFKRESFWKVGGWDEKMISGEDWDLTRKIRSNYQVSRINSRIYHNEYRLTLWRSAKKKFYYSSVAGIYLEKNPLTILSVIFFIFRPAYLRNWKLILSDPLHGVGMFLLKFTELVAGGAGFLVSQLPNRS